MKMPLIRLFTAMLILSLVFVACKENPTVTEVEVPDTELLESQKVELEKVMQKHLDAVSNRDLETLASTMSPEGNMQLILPGTEIIEGVDGFMNYHKEWFQDTSWTFQTKILNSELGSTHAMVITEVVYGESEREGIPYWNRMIVSYDLKKYNGEWYIIKDHASSIEKSTDTPKGEDQ